MTSRSYNFNDRVLYKDNPALVQTHGTEIKIAIRDIGGALSALHTLDWMFQNEREMGLDTVTLRLEPSLSTKPQGASLYIPRSSSANYVILPHRARAGLQDVLSAYMKMLLLPAEYPNGKREVRVVGVPENLFDKVFYENKSRGLRLGRETQRQEPYLTKGPPMVRSPATFAFDDGVPQFFSVREPQSSRGLTPSLYEIMRRSRSGDSEVRILEPSEAFVLQNR